MWVSVMANLALVTSKPAALRSAVDKKFHDIFDAVNDGIFIADPTTGRFIEVNEPGCRMLGYERSEIIGSDIAMLSSGVHPYTQEMAFQHMSRIRAGEPMTLEWQSKKKDGTIFWSEVSVRFTEFGDTPAIVALIRDVSKRKRIDDEIVFLAEHDVLTGLANRPAFATDLDRAINQSRRSEDRFSILYLDLDHFKDVNDTLGHPVGDLLLQSVAERLKAAVRPTDTVARFGGDEFAILLSGTSEPSEIAVLANRLIASISAPYQIEGNQIHISVTIGVAIFGTDARDSETLLSQADIALYRAKADGRKTYQFFSDAMNEEVRSRVMLTDELRRAIPAGEMFLVYQPQVTAKAGRISGLEALVRWRHPVRGNLPPSMFLPVAETSGLIGPLGTWVLREACRQGREWLDAGVVAGTIAVNLATEQFKAPLELEKMIFEVLAETHFPADQLELEITETAMMNFTAEHEQMVQRLREAGIRIALDDFGTGYSSLIYLRRFTIDRIKIAREFVAEVVTSAKDSAIVRSILSLAHDLGSEVIAEGVEDAGQLRLLQEWACSEVQGYYFAKPMSAEGVLPLLKAGRIDPSKTAELAIAA